MDPMLRKAIQAAIDAAGLLGLSPAAYFAKATEIALSIIMGKQRPAAPVDDSTVWAGIQQLDDEAWKRNQPAWPPRAAR